MPSKSMGKRSVASRGKSLLALEAAGPTFSIIAGQKLPTGTAFSTLPSGPSLHWFLQCEKLRPSSVCCLLLRVKHCFP